MFHCFTGNQLNGLSHSSSSFVHGGGAGAWPSVAQWGVGAGDVHQSRQSSRSILMGSGDQQKDMAEMFGLIDNTSAEYNDLSGMFNYS